jgi:hypothetical protein
MKDKWLYEFEVFDKKEIEETEVSKNENGEEVKTTKKITKPVTIKFKIKKPTRSLFEEAELFYGVKLAEGIKAGMLTRPLLAKRYSNDGGPLSDPDKQRYAELYLKLFQKESEFQRLSINLDNLSKEEKDKKISEVSLEMEEIRKALQDFEMSQMALFDQTAENRARNQTIMWWVLNLSFKQKENTEEFESIFPQISYESKIETYDELDNEENPFWQEVFKKLAFFISFWYIGRINGPEDFKKAEEFYKEQNPKVETAEQKSV